MPPNTINEIIQELKTKTGVPKEDSHLFGETVTHLTDGMDSYFNVVQNIREFCGLANPTLTVYKQKLTKAESLAAQKRLLLRVLRNELDKMNRAQVGVNEISSSIKEAAEKMTILQNRLKNKSDAQSVSIRRFGESTGEKLTKAYTGIIEINGKLKNQIKTIENLKIQIERSESHVSTAELRNVAVHSAEKLINDCNEYRKIQTF